MNDYGITLLMSNVCNNKCRYCYQRKETHHNSMIMTYLQIREIINYFEKDNNWNRSIEFFGGEPMLSNNLMKTIVKEYPNYNYHVITNGFFLNENDYLKYVNGLENISIVVSIEGTKRSHAHFRNANNDHEIMLTRIIELFNKGYNISVNMSINQLIFDDLNEFILNAKKLIENGIGIHFYSIKGEDLIKDLKIIEEKLLEIKSINKEIYNKLINFNKGEKESDTEFLCTFDNTLTVNSNLDVISCQWDNTFLGNVREDDLGDVRKRFIERIAYNHKSLWSGCSNCNVPLGDCHISCVPYIMEQLTNGAEKLEFKCELQRLLHKLRMEEKGECFNN